MTTIIRWYGHAAFEIRTAGRTVLIDPFFTGNPLARATAESVSADYILITHGHGDHLGDALEIATRTGAKIIANYELCNWISAHGVNNVHPQHIGGGFHHPFGYAKMTIAHHGSGLPDGTYGGNPCGFLLTLEGKKVYFAGDTGLFLSMQLYGDEGIELAFLPVGDNFTMGPEDAFRAVKLLRPARIAPIHFDTWPIIAQPLEDWRLRIERETQSKCHILQPGGEIEL